MININSLFPELQGSKAETKLFNSSSAKIEEVSCEYMSVEDFCKKYKVYEHNRGNGTDLDRVKEIAKAIAFDNTGWMLEPVIVDSTTNIILDKNHSGLAQVYAHYAYGVDLKICVRTIKRPKNLKVAEAVKELNNNRNSWSLSMYIINQINEGNPNYIRLKQMAEELGEFFYTNENGKEKYLWRYTAALAGKRQQEQIKTWNYVLTPDDKEKQVVIGKEIIAIWEAAGKPKISSWIESFIVAWCSVREKETTFKYYNYFEKVVKFFSNKENHLLLNGNDSTKYWIAVFKQIAEHDNNLEGIQNFLIATDNGKRD